MDSEILIKFNHNRKVFSPYHLTCEKWTPCLMRHPDRHNEIEINYFPSGEMTYLFQGRKISIPSQKMAIFWGLIPHQIIDFKGNAPYYVCTIPFSQFLNWNLPKAFVDQQLKGKVFIEQHNGFSNYDEFILQRWSEEIKNISRLQLVLLEMQARLTRMAVLYKPEDQESFHNQYTATQVEKIAIYIAQNYREPIKLTDIGKLTGLHPDYANHLFKNTFQCTINKYIIEERITSAQRALLTSHRSINQIALENGFNSLSRFNAAFLKINGCTPREYRKKELGLFQHPSF